MQSRVEKKVVDKKVPLPRALAYVALSVVLIWGTFFLSWWYHDYIVKQRMKDDRFIIQGILTSTPDADCLSSNQLAYLLGLDKERSINLYTFDPDLAELSLKSFAACRTAQVRRIRPNAVSVTYEMRRPKFRLIDFEDVAADDEGYPFSLAGIYSPKRLIGLYLGVDSLTANKPLDCPEFSLAKEVLACLETTLSKTVRITRIDTHNVFSSSRGLREVVVGLEDAGQERLLRLSTDRYPDNLRHYLSIKQTLDELLEPRGQSQVPQIVDFRGVGFALVR